MPKIYLILNYSSLYNCNELNDISIYATYIIHLFALKAVLRNLLYNEFSSEICLFICDSINSKVYLILAHSITKYSVIINLLSLYAYRMFMLEI